MSGKPRIRRNVTLALPDEFIALCGEDGVMPEIVLRGFIADLCELQDDANQARADGYACHGPDERFLAQEYYSRAGYRTGRNGCNSWRWNREDAQ